MMYGTFGNKYKSATGDQDAEPSAGKITVNGANYCVSIAFWIDVQLECAQKIWPDRHSAHTIHLFKCKQRQNTKRRDCRHAICAYETDRWLQLKVESLDLNWIQTRQTHTHTDARACYDEHGTKMVSRASTKTFVYKL